MALTVGAIVARFQGDVSNLRNSIGEAKATVSGFKSTLSDMGSKLSGFMTGATIAVTAGTAALTAFSKSSLDAANDLDRAIISLEILSERFGQSTSEAKKQAEILGKDLRIGTVASADAMQNLIKAGLTIPQASDMLRRFTNEAITGKSANIDLATAVRNLSFAYATNNSAIGNLSGINENFINIIDNGKDIIGSWNGKVEEQGKISVQTAQVLADYEKTLKSQGKSLDDSSDEQGKYIGMLALTNLTLGSSDKLLGTNIDKQNQMSYNLGELKLAWGKLVQDGVMPFFNLVNNPNLIAPIYNGITNLRKGLEGLKTFLATGNITEEFTKAMGQQQDSPLITMLVKLREVFITIGEWIKENKEIVLTFFQGLAIGLGALLIIGTIVGLLNLFMNPLTLVVLGITALYMAWKTNFLGMRDITDVVVQFVMATFEALKVWWEEWGGVITGFFTGLWDFITGVFQLASGIILGIIAVLTGLLTGNWGRAGEMLKSATNQAWEGIKKIIIGALEVIMNGIYSFIKSFTSAFDDLWQKAVDFGKKIKDALSQISPFHRSSPSLVEYVQMGTQKIQTYYEGLSEGIADLPYKANLMGVTGALASIGAVNALPTVAGATITQNVYNNVYDGVDADVVSKRIYDKLSKLQ